MSAERVVRDQIVLFGSQTLPDAYPIHMAGASLLCRNAAVEDAVLSVDESADGVTWGTVLLNTPTEVAVTSVTIKGLSFANILFTSASKYVRISLAAASTGGVYISLVQFPPKPQETAGYGA